MSAGVIVEWREGTLRANLPLPGDIVDSLMTNHNGNYALKRGAAEAIGSTRQIAISAYDRLHGIATYFECDGHVVVALVWHLDPRTLSEQVVRSFRCDTPPI